MRTAVRVCLLIAFACGTSLLAGEPKAVVVGKTRAYAGSDVFLNASQSRSDYPIQWKVIASNLNLLALDTSNLKGGAAILTDVQPGTHRVAAVAVGLPPSGTRPEVDVYIHEITVVEPGTPLPGPAPVPVPPTPDPVPIPPAPPTPNPTPPGPPPLNATAEGVKRLAVTLATSPDRKAKLAAMAANYDEVRTRISRAMAGVPEDAAFRSPAKALLELKTRNAAVAGLERSEFLPLFTTLAQWLKDWGLANAAESGELSQAFEDIANGLRRASL